MKKILETSLGKAKKRVHNKETALIRNKKCETINPKLYMIYSVSHFIFTLQKLP